MVLQWLFSFVYFDNLNMSVAWKYILNRAIDLIIVPSEAPHFDDPNIDADGCVELKWHPISEEHQNGRIIGHTISYETNCYGEDDPSYHSGNVNVSAPSMTETICDLHSGLQYRVGIAGFTSKGTGHFNFREDVFASKSISF